MTTQLMAITCEEDWLQKRKGYLTSTESASLFGLQMPSLPTAYELWHIKRGLIDSNIQVNSRMVWGKRLEAVIAKGMAEDYNWKLLPMNAFAYDDKDKIGSSFDNVIEELSGERRKAVLEIKTIAYRDYKMKFIEDDEVDEDGEPVFIEAPEYYEVQCQHEVELLDKYDWVCLAIFIMDTREIKLLWRERDREFGAAIRKKVQNFWSSDEPPLPDLEKDSDLLARMRRANNADSSYDGTKDADFEVSCLAFLQEGAKEKAAKKAKKIIRSSILIKMGKNNTAWCNSARVSHKKNFLVTDTENK